MDGFLTWWDDLAVFKQGLIILILVVMACALCTYGLIAFGESGVIERWLDDFPIEYDEYYVEPWGSLPGGRHNK